MAFQVYVTIFTVIDISFLPLVNEIISSNRLENRFDFWQNKENRIEAKIMNCLDDQVKFASNAAQIFNKFFQSTQR